LAAYWAGRPRTTFSILVTTFLVGLPSGQAPQASPCAPLSLQVALDDSTYLPGQPIILVAKVVNRGDSTVHDLGHLNHPNFLRIVLFRHGRQIPDRYGLRHSGWVYGTGAALQPGESYCAVQDVFVQGGELIRIDMPFGPTYRTIGLPSGKYRMEVYFRCRASNETGNDRIRAPDVEFTVRPASYIGPLDARALRRFIQARANRVDDRTKANWTDLHRRGLDRSRYLVALVETFMPESERAQTADDLRRAGVSPSLRLAAIWATRPRIDRTDLRNWIRDVEPSLEDDTYRCALRSMRILLDNQR